MLETTGKNFFLAVD